MHSTHHFALVSPRHVLRCQHPLLAHHVATRAHWAVRRVSLHGSLRHNVSVGVHLWKLTILFFVVLDLLASHFNLLFGHLRYLGSVTLPRISRMPLHLLVLLPLVSLHLSLVLLDIVLHEFLEVSELNLIRLVLRLRRYHRFLLLWRSGSSQFLLSASLDWIAWSRVKWIYRRRTFSLFHFLSLILRPENWQLVIFLLAFRFLLELVLATDLVFQK